MTDLASEWGRLYLSLAALIGLLVLHNSLRAQSGDDPLNRRFLFGVRVTMAVFVGRALAVLTADGIFAGRLSSVSLA